MKAPVAVEQRCCVADGVTSQREVLRFRYVYLKGCEFHADLWRTADARDREREARREVRP